MAMIYHLRGIEVRLGARFRLMIPKLDLEGGKIYVFAGPNGAGKSTLLRMLALLTMPDSGDLWFQGNRINNCASTISAHRKNVTMVDQSPYLFRGTVFNNLIFGLRLRGLETTKCKYRVASALDAVGLAGFEQRKVNELSGGESQRVALARALALKPEVLILDEPTANIDCKSLAKIEDVLTMLPQSGSTIIMTSHDKEQTRRISGELISIEDGRLSSKPQTIKGHHPGTVIKEDAQWSHPLKVHEI